MGLVETSEVAPGVTTLTLNDPDRRNAMGLKMASEFREAVTELGFRTDLRVLIVTGAGQAFAAGGDLAMLQAKANVDPAQNRDDMLDFYRSFLCILDLPVPVIAAINGHAIGAGFCLALACEFRLVTADAKLGVNFVRLGLHPGMGATLFLPRAAGTSVANDLLISGRKIPAEEALQLGLVQQVVAPGELTQAAGDLAQSLLKCGPKAVAALLKTMRPSAEELQHALQREASEQAMNYAGDEFLEGLQAVVEKRAPQFE